MTDSTAAAVTPDQSDAEIRERVLGVVLDLAPNSDGARGPETSLVQDLGFHSLALMELAFALEDEFDLDPIDEQTARKITTIGTVQDHVVARIHERDGTA